MFTFSLFVIPVHDTSWDQPQEIGRSAKQTCLHVRAMRTRPVQHFTREDRHSHEGVCPHGLAVKHWGLVCCYQISQRRLGERPDMSRHATSVHYMFSACKPSLHNRALIHSYRVIHMFWGHYHKSISSLLKHFKVNPHVDLQLWTEEVRLKQVWMHQTP